MRLPCAIKELMPITMYFLRMDMSTWLLATLFTNSLLFNYLLTLLCTNTTTFTMFVTFTTDANDNTSPVDFYEFILKDSANRAQWHKKTFIQSTTATTCSNSMLLRSNV